MPASVAAAGRVPTPGTRQSLLSARIALPCRELIVVYWAIANYIGNVQVTNKYGHLVGHVKNHGRDPDHPLTRLYSTNAAQPFHCDRGADIIGLCCVHQAKSGGMSLQGAP